MLWEYGGLGEPEAEAQLEVLCTPLPGPTATSITASPTFCITLVELLTQFCLYIDFKPTVLEQRLPT